MIELTQEDANLVLGALDTLGSLITELGHTWSDGERAIYEEAIKILGR
jgi:hypothetical protein